MDGEPDPKTVEARLRERLAELDAEIGELTKPPDDAGSISFGKRVGEGTSQAIDRFAEVGVAQELQPIKERVERALEKLEDGTYGKCDNCGNEIPDARLEAVPSALLCVSCKQGR